MRLAISNIAWDVSEDILVAELLHSYKINAIDIAPTKYFPKPALATEQDIKRIKAWWAAKDIKITGMQSLLFGTSGLNVFGSADVQADLLQHLNDVCRIAAGLGAKYLVFGSPKNRDCSGLTEKETIHIALHFFQRLGNIAQSHDVTICIEPNPVCYGANFLTSSTETAKFVKILQHPAVKMQFDVAAITINNEDVRQILDHFKHLIGHIHVSEPDLIPIGDANTDHQSIYNALALSVPELQITIEMLETKRESHLASIERAVKFTTDVYRPDKRSNH
ncbi:sugar phosphate isomerase/epimerase family protein [Sodalis ligni]|uniref:Sugar phosphate isomerase/epimerase n=1 Tax=Sodalis ligni TaxID=2697027 RepID=A0A4V2Q3N3_9GAMM|nr:TIM barrel protein [Sodalis ligni]TCL07408.1 sugar phosphate isomerase/epimerase [Sodalis ligni]